MVNMIFACWHASCHRTKAYIVGGSEMEVFVPVAARTSTSHSLPLGTGVLHKQTKAAKPQTTIATAPVSEDLAFFMTLQAGAPAIAPAAAAPTEHR